MKLLPGGTALIVPPGGGDSSSSSSSSSAPRILADCTLQVKLASGAVVYGGFDAEETVRDVQRFAASFRRVAAVQQHGAAAEGDVDSGSDPGPDPDSAPDRSVVLCANGAKSVVEFGDEAALSQTLKDAGLVPRAALFVKRAARLVPARQDDYQHRRAAERAAAEHARAAKFSARQRTQANKASVLSSFREDRAARALHEEWKRAGREKVKADAAAKVQKDAEAEAAIAAGAAVDGAGAEAGQEATQTAHEGSDRDSNSSSVKSPLPPPQQQ